ncbi:ORF25 [Ovine gammaherpesvirus 2]|uniref:Major capsid protein-like protein n=1 Tax=Ovine gammaherpesvirus 2 TaxID=10398 RepID=Q2VSL5_9GAMA|nr:ORF25 [Ovine gammaherpesvirus 2]AAX58061.1 ORF25 [Ovine gammaherpesvirus 2]ABB22243.1 major capsid protein-like protein [Ovine gammaherpesvirus 2]
MMEVCTLENRPLPHTAVEANLLRQVKESAAEGLFKSFQLLVGKDVRENSVRFEVLLGVYANVIEFVKFLETGLAASCINTEFRDLRRMVDGKIQFKVSVPTIAHSDGRRPNKQRQYIVMKTTSKHHISAEIELAIADLENMHMEPETDLDMLEYIGTVKTITSALQFGIDALERGLVDTVLATKLRHAPPLFILQSLSDPTLTERGFKKSVKADLVSMFKDHLISHSFFLDKAEAFPNPRQYILGMLSSLIHSVSKETVFKGTTTYTTKSGEPIAGVIETTDTIHNKLLTMLGEYKGEVVGPAAYASYVVRGENLVTAVSYGRAMRSFDQFKHRLVDDPAADIKKYDEAAEEYSSLPQTTIPVSVVKVGNQPVVVESLQKMYNEAQAPFPLNRRMQYSYFFPLGLFIQRPKYTTSTALKIEDDACLSSEVWIVNKNNTPLCFNYQNALRTLCHPRVNSPSACLQELQRSGVNNVDVAFEYGVRFQVMDNVNIFAAMRRYYVNKQEAVLLPIAQKCNLTTDDLLHPTNHKLLQLELHPMFDFVVEQLAADQAAFRAMHRTLSGNIPQPLAPVQFQESRGRQFESATGVQHAVDNPTLEIIRSTAADPTYPVICYMIEAMLHGQQEKFIMNIPFISLCINTYWENSGNLAFINSYFMIKNICTHMGSGLINKEAYSLYRRILGEVVVVKHALVRMAGTDQIGNDAVQGYVNGLLDRQLLPPFAYQDVFAPLENQDVRFVLGPEEYDNSQAFMDPLPNLENANGVAPALFNNRNTFNWDNYARIMVPNGDNNTDGLDLEKIYYYVILPVCTNGHMCGMGADFENIVVALGYNMPVFDNQQFNGDEPILEYLENGPLRDVLVASEVNPTVDMLRLLCVSYLNCPQTTQAVRVKARRDACQDLGPIQGVTIEHTVLINGFACFGIAERIKRLASNMFYPVPFHRFYCDPLVAASWDNHIQNYVMNHAGQRTIESFNTPDTLMADYVEWHKAPMAKYVSSCPASTTAVSTLAVMHNKLSPVAFIAQARHKIHPGFALTVLRTDEVLSENVMYSARASTSVFVGRPTVSRREVRADAVNFEVNHELATIETGLSYSSVISPAHVAAIATDMGIHCQDLFAVFANEIYNNRNVNNYIAQKIGVENPYERQNPRALVAGVGQMMQPPGLVHGQYATCEVIPTPVTADVAYFQKANSPRGRASCVVSSDVSNQDAAERFLYDHSTPDPAYEYRATVNPWASQRASLGDVLYGSKYRQVASPGIYSPSKPFFNKEEMLKNNRSFYTLVSEYAQRLVGYAATSCTDLQYVVINGTDVFLDQPCLFLQEAFPALSASHRALLDEYMSFKSTHAPVHMGHYFIEEVAPVKRVFKIGNKVAA